MYRKLVKLIGKEKIKNDLPLSSVDDKILNFNQLLYTNNKHPKAYYSDLLKRYDLKYSDQDVVAARKLQALAVRDAVDKELERRNYE